MLNTLKSAVKPFAVSLALATTLGIASAPASAAVTHITDATGVLTGATGVEVGTATYSVEFMDGTFDSVFGVAAPDLAFSTLTEAEAATQALLDDVFTGTYDTLVDKTRGCTHPQSCIVYTPYAVDQVFSYASYVSNRMGGAIDVTRQARVQRAWDLSGVSLRTWAKWSPMSNVSAVPEPSTYAMMAMGLFGIAGLRRRQNKA